MKDVNFLINNGVNVQKGLELLGDIDIYNESLHDFLSEVETKLSRIIEFKDTSDMVNYAILVHSLKSDAKYFGFEKLAELAYNHEMESKANNNLYIMEHFDELMGEAKRIVSLVKEYVGVGQINEPSVDDLSSLKDKTILVVDDSNVVSHFIYKIFNDEYDVLIANDGQEALNIINSSVNNKLVGVLLDLNMPNVDGFQVLEYFSQNNLFSKIPVVIITGDSTQENVQRACQYPIVDVLEKPFNESNIKNIIDKIMMISNINS